ncbi:hypothetical protein O181_019538 [Austropuccinia psidii MF-1]|uniref:Reverse transcriptase Ty1/copia-type domain-containing protein n=1 Tax=Austropuccinia psidii MF-1 TaxID=1389203 RepID=A0A9Q3C9U3_9BASI|nr:hypothetical protein [Austropuccinia psidii MF-1]
MSCDSSTVSPPHDGEDDVVDEFQHSLQEAEERPHQKIKVIGSWNPVLVSCDVVLKNILPYTRRPLALFTFNSTTLWTLKSVLNSPGKDLWLISIRKELESMISLGLWDGIELDPSFKLVGTMLVLEPKKNHLGNITEYKARLCTQAFTQLEGVYFNRTYAPMGCINSLQTLIVFAEARDLEFNQINMKSAFLNATL